MRGDRQYRIAHRPQLGPPVRGVVLTAVACGWGPVWVRADVALCGAVGVVACSRGPGWVCGGVAGPGFRAGTRLRGLHSPNGTRPRAGQDPARGLGRWS